MTGRAGVVGCDGEGLLKTVNEEDEVVERWLRGREDSDRSPPGLLVSLSRSLSLLKGEIESPILVLRRDDRLLSRVGDSGEEEKGAIRSVAVSGRGEKATDDRSMLGA